jgi:hypothetical protein
MDMRSSASPGAPGFKNNRLGGSLTAKYDMGIGAAFSRVIELRNAELAETARTNASEFSKPISEDSRRLQSNTHDESAHRAVGARSRPGSVP